MGCKMVNIDKYKVELDIKSMNDIISCIDYVTKYPCTKRELYKIRNMLSDIIQNGCFKHNILRETFRISDYETVSICKKCNPLQYRKLKQQEKDNE